MPRPPCTVCLQREGLQHHETLDGFTDVWFCTFECELAWKRQVAKKRRFDLPFPGVVTDPFRQQWPELAKHMDQLQIHEETKRRIMASRVMKPDPVDVLAPDEVAEIKGVEMPKNDKKTCVVCNKHLGHNHPGAMFCSGSGGCGEKAANALVAIRKLQPVADRALRFLAGLNLQDHSIKEQREQVEITNQLVNTLRPKRGTL